MFEVTSDLDAVLAKVEALALRQLPSIASRALNATIRDVQVAIRAEEERAFDRPTPFALNAFEVKAARMDDLVATLQPKAQAGRRHFLPVEAAGGPRPSTGVEGLINRSLRSSTMIAAIPGAGAKLDRYGNWSGGQRNAVLSAIGAQRDKTANSTKESRAIAKAARARARYAKLMGLPVPTDATKRQAWEASVLKADVGGRQYFVPQHGLAPGVWARDSGGQLTRILAFTQSAPTYEPRFNFHAVAQAKAAEVMPGHFARRFVEAIGVAR